MLFDFILIRIVTSRNSDGQPIIIFSYFLNTCLAIYLSPLHFPRLYSFEVISSQFAGWAGPVKIRVLVVLTVLTPDGVKYRVL